MPRLAVAIATALGAGYVPFAPGTVGSAAGLVLYVLVRLTGQSWVEAAAIVAVYVMGVWAATAAERHFSVLPFGPDKPNVQCLRDSVSDY